MNTPPNDIMAHQQLWELSVIFTHDQATAMSGLWP